MNLPGRHPPVHGVDHGVTVNVNGEVASDDTSGAPSAGMPAAWLVLGQVMHERLRPLRNRFVYPAFFVRCNVERLGSLHGWWFGIDRWAPLSLHRKDYGPRDGSELAPWMRRQLASAGLPDDAIGGAIWLQTLPRMFGYVFNPISLWYCHDTRGDLRAVLAEVRNTFGGRHAYLLTAPGHAVIDAGTTLRCDKALHVSPFCLIEGHYDFRLRDTAATAFAGIDYHDGTGLLIRTAVGGRKVPLTRAAALGALWRQPWLTLSVTLRIHWQAWRLWRARVPFHGATPPEPSEPPDASTRQARQALSPASHYPTTDRHSLLPEEIQS